MNTEGYRFPYTLTRSYNTYIARLDWNLNAKNTLFWRGNLQNDDEPTAPAFPGQPPATSTLTNNKGFAVGYTAILSSSLVNNLRYGFTRQGVGRTARKRRPARWLLAWIWKWSAGFIMNTESNW